jgi:hypothetical protein
MNEIQSATQKFGAAKRNRHERETMAILGKTQDVSRENMRKVEKVDKTAPAAISKAMGKTISIHKAYEINKFLQRMPEEERDALAVWLLCQEIEERESGVRKEKVIAKKLSAVMTIAARYSKYLTEEAVDIYLKYDRKSLSDCADMIDDAIWRLQDLKLIFQKRRLKQEKAVTQNFGDGKEAGK